MAIFNSYVSLPEGIIPMGCIHRVILNLTSILTCYLAFYLTYMVGKCPALGILNITFKYLLEIGDVQLGHLPTPVYSDILSGMCSGLGVARTRSWQRSCTFVKI